MPASAPRLGRGCGRRQRHLLIPLVALAIIYASWLSKSVGAPEPINTQSASATTNQSASVELPDDANCLTARMDAIPLELHRRLPKPYINLGFPKMGTSTLHNFFQRGRRGLVSNSSTHYFCHEYEAPRPVLCVTCIQESVRMGLPPLANCHQADAYTQLDNGYYFPQIELLEEFVHGHPNATLLLTFRNISNWYRSISNWPPKLTPKMSDRFRRLNITGSPSKEGTDPHEFREWYCNHVTRVRDLVAKHPSHTLVEIDIEDSGVAQHMERLFDIDKKYWGHANANAKLEPGANSSATNPG